MACKKKKGVKMKRVLGYKLEELQPYGLFPNGVPELTPPFGDRKEWLVSETFVYIDKYGNLIIIDKDELSDLASIPKPLRIIFGVNKRETVGAVIHDCGGYRNQKRKVLNIFTKEYVLLKRRDWDGILSDVMKMAKTKPIREKAIAAGIFVGGWYGWRANQKKAEEEA